MMDKEMRHAFEAWQAEYWNTHANYPNGRKCVEWALNYLRSQQEPVACLVETEDGVMVWPIENYKEAVTYCDGNEQPVKLYAHPAPSAPTELEGCLPISCPMQDQSNCAMFGSAPSPEKKENHHD